MSNKGKIFWVFIGLFIVTLLRAQTPFNNPDYKSIHQLEWERHRDLPKMPSFFDPTGKGIVRLSKKAIVSPLHETVFGYLPYWEYTTARNYLQYDLLTHIALFDFGVSASGNISNPSYWPWTDVINAAHQNGVKVIMTVVNFNADQIHTILTEENVKNTFFTQLKSLLGQYALDGVNIDFEGLYSADRGSVLNRFMTDLSASVKQSFPDAEISFAGPAINWGGWDLLGLSQACDYIFIMGYAFSGGWSTNAAPTAPLTGGSYNLTNTLSVQYAEVINSHPEKLILGLPYYGCRWQTKDAQKRSATIDFIDNPFYAQARKEAENYGDYWDNTSQTPWYNYQIGSQWYQVWYDNARSLALKYDLADSYHLKGVGMWALGYDNGRSELWNLLRQRYLPQSQPPPETPKTIFARPGANGSSLFVRCDSVYGADGYAVYLSTDGNQFSLARQTAETEIIIDSLESNRLYFLLIRTFNDRGYSPYSSLLAASTTAQKPALLIDGFERDNGGTNTYRYLKYHGFSFSANGMPVASATNDALQKGLCTLDSFRVVDWMLGNEGSNDFTFNAREQTMLKHFLENGGRLLVSGSEIGWDLVAKGSPQDRLFFQNYLKARYIADAPLNQPGVYYRVDPLSGTVFDGLPSFSFDNGTHGTYDVRWPDAILPVDEAVMGLKFSGVATSNGGCGIYYAGNFGSSDKEGRLVLLSFPLETVYLGKARNDLTGKILDFLQGTTGIDARRHSLPIRFKVWPNFPNPFNSATQIRFGLSVPARVTLQIFDIRGKMVFSTSQNFVPGTHAFIWSGKNSAGQSVASGIYVYRLHMKNAREMVNREGRMILVK